MASPNIYNRNKGPASRRRTIASRGGFTLIEIIVVLAIFIFILSFGMTIDFSSFTKNSFEGEEAKIVSILERARSSAMANIFDRAHGVCYDSAQHNYVIFKGNSCTSTNSELIPANTSVSENTGTVFPAFVFSRLTGNTTAGTIHITDGVKSADIVINAEGAID